MIERAGVMLDVEYLKLNKASNRARPYDGGAGFLEPGAVAISVRTSS